MVGGNNGDGNDYLVIPQHRVLDILSFCTVVYKLPKVISGISLIVYLSLNYGLVRSHYRSSSLKDNICRVLYAAVLFSFNLNNFKIGEFIIICKLFGFHRYKSVSLSIFLNFFFEVLFKYFLNYTIINKNYNFYLFKFFNLNLLLEFKYFSSINLLIYYLSTYFIIMIEVSDIPGDDLISSMSKSNNSILISSSNNLPNASTSNLNNNINTHNNSSTTHSFGISGNVTAHGNEINENETNTSEVPNNSGINGINQGALNDQDESGSQSYYNHSNNYIIDNQLVFKVDDEISNSKFNQYIVLEDNVKHSHSSSFPLNSDVKEFLYSNKLASSFSTIFFNLRSYYNLNVVHNKNKNFRNRFSQPFYSIISALYVTRSQKNLFNGESSIAEYNESSLISYDDKIKILPIRSFINYIGDTSLSFNIVKLLQFNNSNIIVDNNFKIEQINIKVNNIDWNYHNYDNNLIILIGLTPLHNYHIKVYINNFLINNYLVSTSNEDFQTFNVQSPLSTLEDSKNFSVKMVELEKYVLRKLRRNHSKSLNELQKEIEILKNKVAELNNKEEKTWQKKNFLNQELNSLNIELNAKKKDLTNLTVKVNNFKESQYEIFLKNYNGEKSKIESTVIIPYNEKLENCHSQEKQLLYELNNIEAKNKKLKKKSDLKKMDWNKINDDLQIATAEFVNRVQKDREERKVKRDKLLKDSKDEYYRVVKLKNDNIERSRELEKQDRNHDADHKSGDNANDNKEEGEENRSANN